MALRSIWSQGEDFMDSIRHSAEDVAWPLRPWIWAIICAGGAYVVNRLVENGGDIAIWRQVAATFVIVITFGFVLTAEIRRLVWAIGFAFSAASVLAFVGWFTAAYNKGGEIAEYPFLAGIFALLIAAPLFQTVRDEGAWRFPYSRLHSHVWTDAVIGGASAAFTGISFLLAYLIAQLFNLIGIKFFTELLREDWFIALLAGFAFGAALGLLRERDALVATLQKLVLVILAVLAPVLAFALVGFLLSLPFTGLSPLWASGVPTTPVLLFAAAGAAGLINAVIGDGNDDGSHNRVLRWSALLLSCCILPLAVIAAISMGVRIEQYGFTPDRIWGLLAVLVASVYGVAYLVAALKAGRAKALVDWDDHIRPANVRIALGVCALALFLALPIADFGAMSARDQLARLKSGVTEAQKFDWRAMAFDFGPKGREALKRLATRGSAVQQKAATVALASDRGWQVEAEVLVKSIGTFRRNFTFEPAARVLDEKSQGDIIRDGFCRTACRVIWLGENRIMVVGNRYNESYLYNAIFSRNTRAEADAIIASNKAQAKKYAKTPTVMVWERENAFAREIGGDRQLNFTAQSKVELRSVKMRQVYVDGKAVGEVFAK